MNFLGRCNLCGFPVVKINSGYFGSRCVNCRSTKIHRAIALVIQSFSFSSETSVYELSAGGSLFQYLKQQFLQFYYSEYFDDVTPGLMKAGIVCQDVQNLLLRDRSFDLVTSSEVFEHVPDDHQGFTEIYRILKPNGNFIFTVPLGDELKTVERCKLMPDGTIQHFLEPEYHGDKIRGRNQVLAFRNYGLDLVEKLQAVGFKAEIKVINSSAHLISEQKVIVATK